MNRTRHIPSTFVYLIYLAAGTILLSGNLRAEIIEAQWQVYQARFQFTGMNTGYTCDSIESTLKRLLRLMGARKDVRAESLCTNFSQVSRFHRVNLAFAIPVPADKTDLTREIIPAKWKNVRITGNMRRNLDAGDCELLEQFERQVMFRLESVENPSKRIHCAPYRREFNNMRLRLKVLVPMNKPGLEKVRSGTRD